MKTQASRIVILLIPIVVLYWHSPVYSVVAPEAEASVGDENGSLKLKIYITRAEAAKQLAAALELPVPEADPPYQDVRSSHWAKNYIAAVTKSGLFHGYGNGSFKPEQQFTREEMAKVLVVAYKPGGNDNGHFSDVSSSWAKDYISALAKNRMIDGYPDGTFKPDDPITQADFSRFLIRASDMDIR